MWQGNFDATAKSEAGLAWVEHGALNDAVCKRSNPGAKGHKRMKSGFLQKQISRREMLRYSTTFAGSALLTNFFSAGLFGASTAGYAQQAPSAADLLADMRARFNAAPLETQRLGEDITMLSGPGGSRSEERRVGKECVP